MPPLRPTPQLDAFLDFVNLVGKLRMTGRPRPFPSFLEGAAARDATSLGVRSPRGDGRGLLLAGTGLGAALAQLGTGTTISFARPVPLFFQGGGGIGLAGRF